MTRMRFMNHVLTNQDTAKKLIAAVNLSIHALSAINLQLANCNSALALYRERMAVVLMERRSLAAQMSSCLTALQLEEAQGRVATGSSRREQLTLEAEEAASALDANVAAEGHTMSLARVRGAGPLRTGGLMSWLLMCPNNTRVETPVAAKQLCRICFSSSVRAVLLYMSQCVHHF